MNLYKDDNYEYIFDENGEAKAIMMMNKKGKALAGKITSKDTAKEQATKLLQKISCNHFEYEYDVFVEKGEYTYGEGYNVEFWQKIDKETYSGNKISIILTADGYLDTYVSHKNIENSEIEDLDMEIEVSESSAIDRAFSTAQSVAEEIENKYNNSIVEEHIIDNDAEKEVEPIVSDAELLGIGSKTVNEIEELDINIEERANSDIETYKEIVNGRVAWVVEISDVEANNNYGDMKFVVSVDAENGEVLDSIALR